MTDSVKPAPRNRGHIRVSADQIDRRDPKASSDQRWGEEATRRAKVPHPGREHNEGAVASHRVADSSLRSGDEERLRVE